MGMVEVVRIVVWILWALAVAIVSTLTWAFLYYRPTVYFGEVYLDPRSVDTAAAVMLVTSLLIMGLALWRLLRKANPHRTSLP